MVFLIKDSEGNDRAINLSNGGWASYEEQDDTFTINMEDGSAAFNITREQYADAITQVTNSEGVVNLLGDNIPVDAGNIQ